MARRNALAVALALLLAPAIHAGGAGRPPDVLLSRQLLEARDLAVGDTILLAADPGGAEARPFRIAGSYEPTPDPLTFAAKRFEARVHLPDLISFLARPGRPLAAESVSRINVALRDPADAAGVVRELGSKTAGLRVMPTRRAPSGSDPFVVLKRFHVAIATVTVIGSSAFLLALMVLRADERRQTAGVLRLIGFSKARILQEGLVEGLCIALAGAVLGVLLARALAGPFNLFFQWRYDTTLVFVRITPEIVWKCIALAVPLGVLSGLFASWTFLRRGILALFRR